jgi:2-(1,2-epoxy-1,2-dihydrophenyl)acetyl-CoA isomerase
MNETPILVEMRAGYRILIFNRPQRLNAFTDAMHDALTTAIDDAEADPACRALLITGAGRAFCAGQDLNDRLAAPGALGVRSNTLEQHYNPLIRRLRALPFPVLAAVNGIAAGAGANIALACDIVLAARSARFIQAFAKIGLIPDSGGTWTLPRLAGMARARGLALLGEPLAAEQAETWGLIWKCINDDALLSEAETMCAGFAAAPATGLALIKQALNASLSNDLSTQLDLERDLQRVASNTADYAEGVRAFIEKRPAQFAKDRTPVR